MSESEPEEPDATAEPPVTAPGLGAPVTVVVADVVRRLQTARLDKADPATAIAALLVGEPRNHHHVGAMVTVIVTDAMNDPFRETTANRWRQLRPAWLRPPVIGATVQSLRCAGLLVPTGRYVRCDDSTARNKGKLQPIYSLDLLALHDELADTSAA